METIRIALQRQHGDVQRYYWISLLIGVDEQRQAETTRPSLRVHEISHPATRTQPFRIVAAFSLPGEDTVVRKVEILLEFHKGSKRKIHSVQCRGLEEIPRQAGDPRPFQEPITFQENVSEQWNDWLEHVASYILFDQNRRFPLPSLVTVQHHDTRSVFEIPIRADHDTGVTVMKNLQLQWIWDPNSPEQERLRLCGGNPSVLFDQTSLDALVGLCEHDIASTMVFCMEHALGDAAAADPLRYEPITGRRRGDYEVSRLQRIQRNQEKLRTLGLLKTTPAVSTKKRGRGRPKKVVPPPEEHTLTRETRSTAETSATATKTANAHLKHNDSARTTRSTQPTSQEGPQPKIPQPRKDDDENDDRNVPEAAMNIDDTTLELDEASTESPFPKDPPGTRTGNRPKERSAVSPESSPILPIQRFFATYSKPHDATSPSDHEELPIERFFKNYGKRPDSISDDGCLKPGPPVLEELPIERFFKTYWNQPNTKECNAKDDECSIEQTCTPCKDDQDDNDGDSLSGCRPDGKQSVESTKQKGVHATGDQILPIGATTMEHQKSVVGTFKRPRGRAPRNKVWDALHGMWKDPGSEADEIGAYAEITEQETETTLRTKPRGRTSKGKTWDPLTIKPIARSRKSQLEQASSGKRKVSSDSTSPAKRQRGLSHNGKPRKSPINSLLNVSGSSATPVKRTRSGITGTLGFEVTTPSPSLTTPPKVMRTIKSGDAVPQEDVPYGRSSRRVTLPPKQNGGFAFIGHLAAAVSKRPMRAKAKRRKDSVLLVASSTKRRNSRRVLVNSPVASHGVLSQLEAISSGPKRDKSESKRVLSSLEQIQPVRRSTAVGGLLTVAHSPRRKPSQRLARTRGTPTKKPQRHAVSPLAGGLGDLQGRTRRSREFCWQPSDQS